MIQFYCFALKFNNFNTLFTYTFTKHTIIQSIQSMQVKIGMR